MEAFYLQWFRQPLKDQENDGQKILTVFHLKVEWVLVFPSLFTDEDLGRKLFDPLESLDQRAGNNS